MSGPLISYVQTARAQLSHLLRSFLVLWLGIKLANKRKIIHCFLCFFYSFLYPVMAKPKPGSLKPASELHDLFSFPLHGSIFSQVTVSSKEGGFWILYQQYLCWRPAWEWRNVVGFPSFSIFSLPNLTFHFLEVHQEEAILLPLKLSQPSEWRVRLSSV